MFDYLGGKFKRKFDQVNRMSIPPEFRELLGSKVYLISSLYDDPCIWVFSEEKFAIFAEGIDDTFGTEFDGLSISACLPTGSALRASTAPAGSPSPRSKGNGPSLARRSSSSAWATELNFGAKRIGRATKPSAAISRGLPSRPRERGEYDACRVSSYTRTF